MNPPEQKLPKKRKLNDRSLPASILSDPQLSVDSQMYQDLLEMEKKLDWTIMRKKAEVQDALGRTAFTTRTLRLFLSHTASGQAWQSETSTSGTAEPPNFETGQGIPAWQLKIEGRLLEPPNQRAKDRTPPKAFSTLIKTMVVELDRDPALYTDGNIVEWHQTPSTPTLDGFTIRRMGDTPTKARLILHLQQYPEQFRVLPELGNILGIKEESRAGVVQSLWGYIKTHNLQDKVDRKRIHADAVLRPIFGADVIPFNLLPDLVNRHLAPPNPVVIYYTVNPSTSPPERPSAWDIEIKLEDVALKSKMQAVTLNPSRDTLRELTKLDDEIATLAQSLQSSVLKRQFLQSFADDPSGFIQTWLASQSRDLESILGSGPSEGATIRKEDLSRSEFFRMPWVEEAVAIWDGMRIANKVTG
ncbi:SWI/SNF complex subunit [Russula earlei]|uniref:SWI/SNF complex subunit n=1 Tax=Russula earlei TaxID=71964 RepID=A0ACC0TYW9_9AGAM|nr:SWI/SNF complex subunit [Russula earlei]